VRLMRASCTSYCNLRNKARELQLARPGSWEGGACHLMIMYHSNKLLQIRMHSMTKKLLLFRTYTYLRDAESRSFYIPTMTESLYSQLAASNAKLADLSLKLLATTPNNRKDSGGGSSGGRGANGDGKGGNRTKKPKCSHCKTPQLHDLLKVGPGKGSCPLTNHRMSTAQKIEVQAIEAYEKESEDRDMKEVLKEAEESLQEE